MTIEEKFKAYKKEILNYIDKKIGFVNGMEIFLSDSKVNICVTLDMRLIINEPFSTLIDPIQYAKRIGRNVFVRDSDTNSASLGPADKVKLTTYYKLIQNENSGLTDKEEEIAIDLLKGAIFSHGNKVIVGYSGGKDSKVILHLARRACPEIVAVHNSHPEEKCDLPNGVVIIKEPKSNFKEYLKYVDVTAQIDGTRLYEEGKTVIVNGKEIERDEMTHEDIKNFNGVFGLEIYYPILLWTDKMVWQYIEKYKLMTAYEISIYQASRSYRGEIH